MEPTDSVFFSSAFPPLHKFMASIRNNRRGECCLDAPKQSTLCQVRKGAGRGLLPKSCNFQLVKLGSKHESGRKMRSVNSGGWRCIRVCEQTGVAVRTKITHCSWTKSALHIMPVVHSLERAAAVMYFCQRTIPLWKKKSKSVRLRQKG